MNDEAEQSIPSRGSQPVAWAVEWKGDTTIDRSTFCYTEDGARCKADECPALAGVVVPLYRRPQPTLTDEEREAIEEAIRLGDQWGWSETLRGLLERLG